MRPKISLVPIEKLLKKDVINKASESEHLIQLREKEITKLLKSKGCGFFRKK